MLTPPEPPISRTGLHTPALQSPGNAGGTQTNGLSLRLTERRQFIIQLFCVTTMNDQLDSKMATKRSLNKCGKCKNTWYPKGKNLSTRCPACGDSDVKYAGMGLLGKILTTGLVISAIAAFSGGKQSSPPSSHPEPGGRPTAPAAAPSASAQSAPNLVPGPIEYRTPQVSASGQGGMRLSQTVAPVPAPALRATEGDKTYSRAEIEQLEQAKQYYGDDPIIRRRLGLPSKDTGKLIP